MIRAVLFDLDGTLYDRDAVVRAVAHEQFAAFEPHLSGIDRETFVQTLLALDDHGYANRGQLYRAAAAALGLSGGLAADLALHFWDCYANACVPAADALSTLRALRAHGARLGVVTNGPAAWQTRKLHALGLGDAFDAVLISETEGLAKPDVRIFIRAVERLNVAPGDAMFVGDHPEIDVAGASAAGLVPVWKRVPYWTLASHDVLVVDTLSGILPRCLQT